MRKSHRTALDIPPEEVCASDAKLAITTQETQPIGEYFRQLSIVLRWISGDFEAAHQDHDQEETHLAPARNARGKPKQETSHESVEDWEGNFDQISQALESKNSALISAYLRDAGDVLSRFAPLLDPPKSANRWHLKFARKGRGRPPDATSKTINESNRRSKLRAATREYGKQEAAIESLKGRPGNSRASLLRAKERK